MVFFAALIQTPLPWVNEPKSVVAGITHHAFKSPKNGVDIGYCVYVPADFEASKKRYPLVIFLHGSGGNENSDAGGFSSNLNAAVAAKTFPASVILFPNGRQSGYADHPERGEFIETWIISELIPFVEKEYRAGGSCDRRVICGFSMGGAGSTRLALTHPGMFAGVVAFGGSGGRGTAAIDAVNKNAASLRDQKFRIFMGVGEKDPFAQAAPFQKALDDAKIENVYKFLPGIGHDLGVYYTLTAEAFRFVGRGISR